MPNFGPFWKTFNFMSKKKRKRKKKESKVYYVYQKDRIEKSADDLVSHIDTYLISRYLFYTINFYFPFFFFSFCPCEKYQQLFTRFTSTYVSVGTVFKHRLRLLRKDEIRPVVMIFCKMAPFGGLLWVLRVVRSTKKL